VRAGRCSVRLDPRPLVAGGQFTGVAADDRAQRLVPGARVVGGAGEIDGGVQRPQVNLKQVAVELVALVLAGEDLHVGDAGERGPQRAGGGVDPVGGSGPDTWPQRGGQVVAGGAVRV